MSLFAQTFNGVVYAHSKILLAQVTDGTSHTLLVGEKYLNPRNYENGADAADNENLYVGFDNDNARSTHPTTGNMPRKDHPQLANLQVFGSAHPGALNISLCDGSVRTLSYTVDLTVFQRMGNRSDGKAFALE